MHKYTYLGGNTKYMGHVFELCFALCHKYAVAHVHGRVFDGKLRQVKMCNSLWNSGLEFWKELLH